ncbi:tubulin polyglutamylase TTLL5 isoform X1 [Boleophthalmus pectinirostris]|uniref:tubulin polyglutamylase TTLL5 isoform X1 n=1 Tax=Boleophthalmus pectinirostris TaxID=150288 RepID=UPI00242B7FF8|nr:tubulin polyglutamylase TTLL5 isoform X1 [Boleophthalmus pectinirostris]
MPAVTRDQEDSESSSDDEHEELHCIAWSGTSKTIPILMFFPEAIVSKDDRICSIGDRYKMAFKIVRTESRLVRGLLTNHGFHEVHPNSNDFNLMWTGSHLKPYILRGLQDFQKVNHFPRSYELTRKDRLYKNIQRMQQAHGFKNFHIVPQTFVLPSEYQDFCSYFAKDKGPWIIKPVASSRGRGIYLVSNPNQISMDENILVSRYIHNPLLIDDFKFDMRLYVLVTSYDPLLIYVYEEGLARFATVKYDRTSKNIKNNFMHLTNYSVNKKSSDYVSCDDPEVEDYGNKWSMSAVLRYLKQEGKDTTLLMQQVEDLIIKALLSAEPQISAACKMFVPHKTNCFELYGFDVLIDAKLKPWLLEVNLSPSLACDAPLDLKIKASMIADMFSLVGLVCQDPLSRQPRAERVTLDSSLKHLAPQAQRPQKTTAHSVVRQRHLLSSNSETDGLKGQSDSTLNLTAEEVRVLRRIKEEYERRGGFIRIFPTAETWELYSGYLESKTSLNSMLAHRLFHGRTVQLHVDVLCSSHVVQYERKLQSLEARKRHLHHRSHHSSNRKSGKESKGFPTESSSQEGGEVNGQCEPSAHMVGEYRGQVVTALPLDALHSKAVSSSEAATWDGRPRVNLLHILQQGWDLSKVQARLAFSSYLHRVQQRLLAESRANTIPAWPDKDNDQMELVIRFLKKAASNLQQDIKVGLPSRQLPLQDRRRILSQQLGEFIHHYNKETDHMVKKQEGSKEERRINDIVFQEYIGAASENDLEEVLTFYTQKNKSATIFLGSNVCSLSKDMSTEMFQNVSGEPGNCGDSRSKPSQPLSKDDSSTSESSLSAGKVSSDPDTKVSVNQLSDQCAAAKCGNNTQPDVQASQHRSNFPATLDCTFVHPSSTLPLHCPPPPPPQQPPSYTQSLAKSQFCQADTDPPEYSSSPVLTQPRVWTAATTRPSTQGLRRVTSFTSPMSTSSIPSATHIYSQKLSRPTSAGQVVWRSSSSKLKSNSVGTFKELNALSAQAQSNQQAFISALQRLADKQVVRQYASSNHINLLTQHLSNLNLANNMLRKGSLTLTPKAWHTTAPTPVPVRALHSRPELYSNKRPVKDEVDAWASPFQRAYSVVTGVSPQHNYQPTQGSYQLQYAIQQLQGQRLKSQQLLEQSQSRQQDQSSNPSSVQTFTKSSSCPPASLHPRSNPTAVSLIQTNASPLHVPKPPKSGRSEAQGRKTTAKRLIKHSSSAEISTTGPITNGQRIVYEAICGKSGLSMYRKVFPGQEPSHR